MRSSHHTSSLSDDEADRGGTERQGHYRSGDDGGEDRYRSATEPGQPGRPHPAPAGDQPEGQPSTADRGQTQGDAEHPDALVEHLLVPLPKALRPRGQPGHPEKGVRQRAHRGQDRGASAPPLPPLAGPGAGRLRPLPVPRSQRRQGRRREDQAAREHEHEHERARSHRGQPVAEVAEQLDGRRPDLPRCDTDADSRGHQRQHEVVAPIPARPRQQHRLLKHIAVDLPTTLGEDEGISALSERERAVMIEIAHGATNAEIAARLFLAEPTVKTHVGRILAKLGLRDRVHIVIRAYESGLVRRGGGQWSGR